MVKVPKLPTAEDKLRALEQTAPATAATLANKETGGKPWELADPKTKKPFPLNMPGDLAAKMEFIFQNAEGRPSKTALINKAIEEFADKWLRDNGHM